MDPTNAESETRAPSNNPSTSIPLQSISVEDLTRLIVQVVRVTLEEGKSGPATTPPPGGSRRDRAAEVAQEDGEEKQAERERQRYVIHTSRASVSNLANEAVNITFNQPSTRTYASPQPTPLRPAPPVQTRAAFVRRLSGGNTEDDLSSPTIAAEAAILDPALPAVKVSIPVERMDREQFRRYESTAKRLTESVSKFHGDRVKDGDRTVEEFVELINAEMDAWMTCVQQHGRLNLVIGRTDGIAQSWLAKKRQEMQILYSARQVTDLLLMEWSEVQDDFITEMSKGITSAVYEQQLKAVKIRDKDGKLDVATFIRRFDQICARLYPSSRFTSEGDRRRRLGEKFEERLRYCGEGPKLRDECYKQLISRSIQEKDRMVEDWQDVLLAVASMDEYMNSRAPPAKEKGLPQQKRQSTWSSNQKVSAMAAAPQSDATPEEEDTTQSDEGRPEVVQAAATSVHRRKGKRNPHLSPEQATQLMAKKPPVCLSCYKPGHYSSDCSKPAHRAPTEAELKA